MSSSNEASTALKFRLRTILMVPFVLQILAAVGLVGYLSFRNGQQAVNKLASQVRLEVASRTQLVMKQYLTLPHEITRSNINALRLNQIKLEDKEALERHFFYQLQTYPIIGENFMGTPDGAIVYVGRKPDGSSIANTTSKFPKREQYELDNFGRRRNLIKVTDSYDSRIRPWYKVAVEKRRQSWTGVFLFATQQTLGVSAVEPYYDNRGNLVAVFSTNVPLKEISKFLNTLKVSPTGQTFILDPAGTLVATSTGENSLVKVNGEQQQLQAVESQNLLTRSTARYLQEQFGDFSQIKKLYELSFDIDGKRQNVLVQPYSDPKGLEFLVVVVVPEADFMEQINANNRTTIMLCLLALALAIAVGIFTTQLISRPIFQLAKAAEEMAGGKLDQKVESSQIIELGKLASSFNKMALQLKDSFEKINSVIYQADRVGSKITSSSSQISAASKQLEANVTQQAVSTNEVRATAATIATTSGELLKTVENIVQKATSTATAASSSQENLMEMARAMTMLAESTNNISTKLGIMNEKANNINSVVATISKVADRTNLLSLNAAIEAEKAGEAGVGFAVVAREVRQLAANAATASIEIEEMVKDIQSAVASGVMEMDKFSFQVNNYVQQVGVVSQQIASVIDQVQSLTPQFQKVRQSMEGQFEGAQQISSAIAQLSEASNQIAESLKKTNQAFNQLNDSAQVLQGITSSSLESP